MTSSVVEQEPWRSGAVEAVSPRAGRAWALGLAALAFGVRLETVLRGGGLFGRIGYDGSVYYASASALTRGYLPYADFLLLHPPGIVLALFPFAVLGRLVGDPDAYALARLAWFGLGAVSTALVFAVVRSRGLWPAVAAAAAYAVFVPAVTSEHTTSLEGVGSVCLLGAVALLTSHRTTRTGAVLPFVAAGALLGLATGTKIWGAALVLVLACWAARRHGVRRAGLVLVGAVGATTVICLPFFVAAPAAMWRLVVADQLGRPRAAGSLTGRLVDLSGLSELRGHVSTPVLAGVAGTVLLVLLALAVRDPLGRLAALLLLSTGAVLLATPPWSVAYTGLSAPAVVLLVGCAVARALHAGPRRRLVAAVVVGLGLVGYATTSLPGLTYGSHFPGRSLERALVATPGCVTTDDPIALIETGSLQRNFTRRCSVVFDLSGYSYDLQPAAARHVSRIRNSQWQDFVRAHLADGEAAIVVRFRSTVGLSAHTRAVVAGWPLVADVGGYQVHRPVAPTVPATR